MSDKLRVKKLHKDARLPEKAHQTDLGYDLFLLNTTRLTPGKVTKLYTGIACNFPTGFGAIIKDRSSVATKSEIFVVAGVIDETYTGEIIVTMFNPFHNGFEKYVELYNGTKIAQMILVPTISKEVEEVEELEETDRGDLGFGSSGT